MARASVRAARSGEGSGTANEAGAEAGEGAEAGAEQDHTARARLLLRSYEPDFWYWESLEVLRKYFLTAVILVAYRDSLLQVYLGLLVCVSFALVVARNQPYADPLCGRLQMLCLAQLAFTYMSGMLFFDDGGDVPLWWEESALRWGIILIAVNVLVFIVLGIGLCTAVRDQVNS